MGYIDAKYSERALQSYESGEFPHSHWSKENILWELKKQRRDLDFSRLNKQALVDHFLENRGWHHTGKYFNETKFYGVIDISDLTQKEIDEIVVYKKPRCVSTKKIKQPNNYIVAIIEYSYWEGTRNHPKKKYAREIVKYRSQDKKVSTYAGTKLLSNVRIVKSIEQKTNFADEKRLQKYL